MKIKHILPIALLLIALPAATFLYTQVMKRMGSGTPPAMVAHDLQADLIIVDKSDYTLTLMRDGEPLQTYPIAMGGAPVGHKEFEGDERTPEGRYTIDWRNPNSMAHLSLHISYPNAADTAHAQSLGKSAGGNIMIHGTINGWGWLGPVFQGFDWTNGCIAVTNRHMKDIWRQVPNGTEIVIKA